MSLEKWFSSRDNLSPVGRLAMCGDIFGCHMGGEERGREGCLLSSGGKAQMLLNILQCTGQLLQQRVAELKMSVVLRVRSPSLEDKHLVDIKKFSISQNSLFSFLFLKRILMSIFERE